MASLASINVKFTADLKGFSTEMQTALRQIDKAGQKFQDIGRKMSLFVTTPILAAGAAAIKFASDYNESLNKVDVSFKSSSAEVKDFAKTSLVSFGIAEGTALDMASAYGDMGTSMGLTNGQAAKMSTSLVGLAGDLASFKNISIDIANTAISAIFTGETESLKKLGIVMTEVNLKQFALNSGIKKNYEQMSQAEKVQLRYNYILSVTKNSQGDFARTQGGAANQMRIFTESLKQLGQQFGTIILPLFTKVVTSLNGMITSFGNLSQAQKTTIIIIAGLIAVIGPLALAIGVVAAAIPILSVGFVALSASFIPIFAGLTLLLGAFLILKPAAKDAAKATVELTDSQKLIQKVTDEATGSITEQKAKLELLLLTARNENESKKARLKAIQDINKIAPEYLGNLTLENINTDKARAAIERYNAALISGATARSASRLLEQNQSDKIQAGFKKEKALADYNAKRAEAIAKGWEAEQQFYEDNNRLLGFAIDELERKNTKLDAEAKILVDIYNKNKNNLDVVKETPAAVNAVAESLKKIDVQPIEILFSTKSVEGSKGAYDAKIAELQNFSDNVATTADQVKLAEDRIKALDFEKALKFDPSTLFFGAGGFTKLLEEMQAKVAGYKSVSGEMKTIVYDLSETISNAVTQLAVNAAIGFGEAIGGIIAGTQNLGDLLSGMLGLVANFMKDLGKQLIAIGIARIAFDKLKFSGVGAVVAGIALVALSTVISSKFEKAGRFENGGVVGGSSYYGDKIMARVNSGELILNQKQQANLYGAMNTTESGFVSSTKIQGSDLLVIIERANARKNRIG